MTMLRIGTGTSSVTWPAAPEEQLVRRRLRLRCELRPPVAECLQRNPLSLAILSLIQLTPTPRLMVRPPERLAVTHAGKHLLRHLVSSPENLPVRTDRVRNPNKQ